MSQPSGLDGITQELLAVVTRVHEDWRRNSIDFRAPTRVYPGVWRFADVETERAFILACSVIPSGHPLDELYATGAGFMTAKLTPLLLHGGTIESGTYMTNLIECLPLLVLSDALVAAFVAARLPLYPVDDDTPYRLVTAIGSVVHSSEARTRLERLLVKYRGALVTPCVLPAREQSGAAKALMETDIDTLCKILSAREITHETRAIFSPMFFDTSSISRIVLYACVKQASPAEIAVSAGHAGASLLGANMWILKAHFRHVRHALGSLVDLKAVPAKVLLVFMEMWHNLMDYIQEWVLTLVNDSNANWLRGIVDNPARVAVRPILHTIANTQVPLQKIVIDSMVEYVGSTAGPQMTAARRNNPAFDDAVGEYIAARAHASLPIARRDHPVFEPTAADWSRRVGGSHE